MACVVAWCQISKKLKFVTPGTLPPTVTDNFLSFTVHSDISVAFYWLVFRNQNQIIPWKWYFLFFVTLSAYYCQNNLCSSFCSVTGKMSKKFAVVCTLGAILASGTWYMTRSHRRLTEEIQQKERELQELSNILWKRRLFWLKVATGCVGIGGAIYLVKKLGRAIRDVKLS